MIVQCMALCFVASLQEAVKSYSRFVDGILASLCYAVLHYALLCFTLLCHALLCDVLPRPAGDR